MTKVEIAKGIHLKMRIFFAISKCEISLPFDGANSSETNLQTCKLPTVWSKLQVVQAVLYFCHLQDAKSFKICKWISFAISTFGIIEEMASARSPVLICPNQMTS